MLILTLHGVHVPPSEHGAQLLVDLGAVEAALGTEEGVHGVLKKHIVLITIIKNRAVMSGWASLQGRDWQTIHSGGHFREPFFFAATCMATWPLDWGLQCIIEKAFPPPL